MKVIRVVPSVLSGRRAFYLLPFAIARLLLVVVVAAIPKEVKTLTIVPCWTLDLEVGVEKKDIKYRQLSQ